MKSKYIVFNGPNGYAEMIIFGVTLKHADIAQKMRLSTDDIVSAGFLRVGCSDDGVKVLCSGDSFTLKKTSRDADNSLARNALGLNSW